jgi:hypothetical protein
METSPIVLFVYNRPWHTRKTIESLKANELANESVLYIYSDSSGNPDDAEKVAEVREYIRTVRGFRNVEIIEHEKNRGLARNIISGVSDVVKEHKKIIVMEDDLVTSPKFLTFMNKALDYYENTKKVWHISGWNYPIDTDELDDVFFYRVMNCWGWATWEDRWRYFEKDPGYLIDTFSRSDISRFDLDNSGIFWSQVLDNARGKLDTWAIFWYATIFMQNGLCLTPIKTYVQNIGHDGSGENCVISDLEDAPELNNNIPSFIDDITESELAVSRIKDYYRNRKGPVHSRILKVARRYANRFTRQG